MSARFERVALVGLGLLGGSVGLAARARGVARRVVGSGRSAESCAAALRCGAVDELADLEHAVTGADLVVLATPVSSMPAIVRAAAAKLERGALVTDVGSVKAVLAETLPGLLPPGVAYVGAHPMAGSHRRGVEHARADLFDGAACVLTPTRDADAAAIERICEFWTALGARVVRRDPAEHDAQVAWVSHLPHVVAFAFARAFAAAPAGARELAGSGFRDFTRIAHSDAELWSEILHANAKALAGPLHGFGVALQQLARALEAEDAEVLERALAEARTSLPPVAFESHARSGGAIPEIQAADESGGQPRRAKNQS